MYAACTGWMRVRICISLIESTLGFDVMKVRGGSCIDVGSFGRPLWV